MWLLYFLPSSFIDFIINTITIVSAIGLVVSFVFSKLPIISRYGSIAKVVFFFLLLVSIYFQGGLNAKKELEEQVQQLETKVKVSEEKAKEINTEKEIQYVTKVKRIKETEYVIKEKIKEVEKLIDAKCEVPSEAVNILNQAATMAEEK